MQVSESGYYAWCQRPKSPRQQANETLLEQIRSVYHHSDQSYGSPRVYQELKANGIACSQNRIARLMRQAGISAQAPKRFVVTTHTDPALAVAENVLARQFEAPTPNARWSADITYVWTGQGWLYLAVILDLFSRRVVGWAMGPTLERFLVVSALKMALSRRKPATGLLCHSDRGSQYASQDYQEALRQVGAVCSMSRRGNCWDNAPTESFFASLKRELVHRCQFATRQQATMAIFGWIEVWYNRKRRHSALGYLSPEAFERQYQQQEPMAA
jgi:transposase InsO family protein